MNNDLGEHKVNRDRMISDIAMNQKDLQNEESKMEKYRNELSLFLFEEQPALQSSLKEILEKDMDGFSSKSLKERSDILETIKSNILAISAEKWRRAQGIETNTQLIATYKIFDKIIDIKKFNKE
jgi:hypothetical protein